MTDKQLSRIKKPSKLIAIALADLRKAERSTKYKINMDNWHKPNGKCAVCFAGSVMAFSLKANPKISYQDWNFKSYRQFTALDCLRVGRVGWAFADLHNLPPSHTNMGMKHPLDREIVTYSRNPTKFKRQMRKLQKDLEKAKL